MTHSHRDEWAAAAEGDPDAGGIDGDDAPPLPNLLHRASMVVFGPGDLFPRLAARPAWFGAAVVAAARFQAIGDISHHAARGDVSVSVQYLDSGRHDDVGVVPFEIGGIDLEQAKKETRTTRPDVNAMKVLRLRLRDGVLAAYRKIEPRLRDALKERADIGHLAAEVTLNLRPTQTLD